ncbi:MAG: GTP-binding protein [Planctomycetes bacterium]|nr:GTP-binding protein [Planctomycetota bacterium]
MSEQSQTLAVRLTPPGRGAVATILVAGSAARDVVGRTFRPAGAEGWSQTELRCIRAGRWNGEGGEEVVVAALAGDQVEVHCHGGDAAAGAILSTLAHHGCQEVSWRDWLGMSHADPLAAEAAIALSQAPTERTAAMLLDQYQGALRCALADVLEQLERGDVPSAREGLDALLALAPLGLHLVEPWRVVIAGRPNVGKSTLLNAILGYQRSIVCDVPGTTRDVVTALTAFDGWPVELADTAGLRSGGDRLESAGMERAIASLATADLTLLVGESGRPWSDDERRMMESGRPTLPVLNKCDLIDLRGRPAGENAIPVSALTGAGLELLAAAIARRLVSAPPGPGAAAPFSSWQVEALVAVRSALQDRNIAAAIEVLFPLVRESRV